MDANFDNKLTNLKQTITQLSIGDRRMLLKWLIDLLQQGPQAAQLDDINVNFEAVHQICNEFRNLPILDNRSPEEIIGYNQIGGLD